jgi:tRNA1(Val) A37 N6-methylase TrmN6
MLAAAVPARAGDTALELGAGVGTASLCLAARTGCVVTGIEIEPDLVELANQNALLNEMAARAKFELSDALAANAAKFDHVFTNPPFHDDTGQRSPNEQRARALQDAGTLKDWVRSGFDCVASKGSFTIISRADRLDEVLTALPSTGVRIFPLHPRQSEAAKRVIVQARQGSLASCETLPGLVLHGASGAYTEDADAVLRGRSGLVI